MKHGFTLLELSIVLVIIGLIIGGITVGQDLIKSAEVQSQISQHNQIEVAINSFKLKYNALPGDIDNATSYWNAGAQPAQVSNGNGDGRIRGAFTAGTSTAWAHSGSVGESHLVFDHLAAADMYNFPQYDETVLANNIAGIAIPEAKFQGTGTLSVNAALSIGGIRVGYEAPYFHIPSGHKIRWGSCPMSSLDYGYAFFFCGYNPQEAIRFDTKMDDGKPLSGKFHVTSSRYIYRVPGDVSNDIGNSCIPADNSNQYNLTHTGRSCHPSISVAF